MSFKVHKVPGPESKVEVRVHQAEQLINDWSKEEGVNSRKFKKGSTIISRIIWFVLILAILSGAVWFALNWFLGPDGVLNVFDRKDNDVSAKDMLTLTLNAPKEIESGDGIEYELIYINNEKHALSEVELILRYPENFNFEKAEPISPANISKNVWTLGSIGAGDSQKLRIYGQVLGDEGEVKKITANITYKPVNIHARFKQSAVAETVMKSSVLGLGIYGPKNLLKDQDVEYTVLYMNNSSEILSDVELKVEYPLAFEFKESEPALEDGETTWTFDFLDPGEEGNIIIRGRISGVAGALKNISAEIGVIENGVFRLQNRTSLICPVIDPKISFDLSIAPIGFEEKEGEKPKYVFGSSLVYAITYTNDSDLELKSVVVDLEIVDIQDVLKSDSFIYAEGSEAAIDYNQETGKYALTWGAKGSAFLKDLKPGESGTISFTVDVVDKLEDAMASSFSFRSKARFEARSKDVTSPIVVDGQSFVIRVE